MVFHVNFVNVSHLDHRLKEKYQFKFLFLFSFLLLYGAVKGFMTAVKVNVPQRGVKIKIYINFYLNFFSFLKDSGPLRLISLFNL